MASLTIWLRLSTTSRNCCELPLVWKLLQAHQVIMRPLPLMSSWST
jgi:hypothetical protein